MPCRSSTRCLVLTYRQCPYTFVSPVPPSIEILSRLQLVSRSVIQARSEAISRFKISALSVTSPFAGCFSCSTQSPYMRLRIKSAEVLACSLQLSIAGVTPSAFTRQVFNLASMIANSDGTCAEAEPHMRAQQIPIPNRFTINARASAVEAGSVYLVRVCLRTASVARMSEATSGIPNPAYRCAHAGYLLCEDYGASI
jgi:hypothetical protein